jgi:hypothetical protein
MQATIRELGCGCEDTEALEPISFCGKHTTWLASEQLYRCGECGFASVRWDRLERHVYREHLGADWS